MTAISTAKPRADFTCVYGIPQDPGCPQPSKTACAEAFTPDTPCGITLTYPARHAQAVQGRAPPCAAPPQRAAAACRVAGRKTPFALPILGNHLNPIPRKERVGRDHRQVIRLGSGDDHAVARVVVNSRQGRRYVIMRNGMPRKAVVTPPA